MLKRYEALLFCGGKGTRMTSYSNKPKPVIRLAGRELIKYTLDSLDPMIIKKIIFGLGYKASSVRQWVESSKLAFDNIIFLGQTYQPLSEVTKQACKHLEGETLIICNTDEIRHGLNLNEMIKYHEANHNQATILLSYSDHPEENRLVCLDKNNKVIETIKNPKEFINQPGKIGLVNAGILILDKKLIRSAKISNDSWNFLIDPLCNSKCLSAYIDTKVKYFNINNSKQHKRAARFLKKTSDDFRKH